MKCGCNEDNENQPSGGYLFETILWFTLLAHFLLTFTPWDPYIGMSIMGLSYSMLAASLWPLVSLIVPEYQLGTAYGL